MSKAVLAAAFVTCVSMALIYSNGLYPSQERMEELQYAD